MDNETIDITKINTQFGSLKFRNGKAERNLLSSISENGILESLLGFFDVDIFILIDGFKRYRCCKKLHINTIPIEVMAVDEANAFIKTLKISNSKSLHILEQAKFIQELYERHNMTMENIANSLEKSRRWVSLRIQLLKILTPLMEDKIFNGSFPAWNAMGILCQVKRLSLADSQEIDEFVKSISGKGLSVRNIELLSNAYFKGGNEFKNQIKKGNLSWCINNLKNLDKQDHGLNYDEKRILKDLEIAGKYIGRISFKLPHLEQNNQFFSTAGLLVEGILDKLDGFQITLKKFIQEGKNDQRRQSKSSMDTS